MEQRPGLAVAGEFRAGTSLATVTRPLGVGGSFAAPLAPATGR